MKFLKPILVFCMSLVLITTLAGCKSEEKKDRLAAIAAKGYIEVATEPYFAPNEFIDPSKSGDAQYVGADIELAKYIADKLGVQLRIVPLEFSAVLAGVTDGKYDLAISALGYNPTRANAMNLSKGYYFTKTGMDQGLLIRKEDAATITGPDALKGKVVVAQSGSLQEEFVTDQVKGVQEFKRVSSTVDGFMMVQEKKADACATLANTAELYIQANPNCGLMMIPNFKFTVDPSKDGMRIGMPKGEDKLLERINQIVDEVVQSGAFEKWFDEYTEYAKQIGVK